MKNESNDKKMRYNSMQNMWYLFKRGWKFDKSLYILNIIQIVCTSSLPFITVLFPKFILDELTGERRAVSIVVILALFFIAMVLFNFVATFLKARIDPKFTELRFKYVREHSETCMLLDYEQTEDSNILNKVHMSSRAVGASFNGLEGMYRKIFSFISDIITLVGFISLTVYLNPLILLYLMASCILVYYVNLRIKKFEHDSEEKLAVTDRKTTYVSGLFNDAAYGKEIRLFGIHKWLIDKYTDLVNERIRYSKTLRRKYFISNLLNIFFLLIREGIIYAYLILEFIAAKITIGDFTMYFNVTNQLSGQIQGILDSVAYIRAQNMVINDYRSFVEIAVDADSGDEPIPSMPYTIEFRNVSFRYPNSEKMIIRNFSYSFEFGKRIALVGDNGAGKTTLIKLMTRLYDPTEGEIFLNGINIKAFDKQEYFRLFSALYQDYKIFAFSINENVSLCEESEIDCAAVQVNLDRVGLTEKVAALPKRAHTSLLKALDYEGIELSGGESQRVALARALYKNGNVFILDEPTAAMDPLAEYQFYQLLNQMVDDDKLYIFISHRLASTRFCDVILMLQDGQILEQGSHEELIEKQGAYYALFELQAKNYREDSTI